MYTDASYITHAADATEYVRRNGGDVTSRCNVYTHHVQRFDVGCQVSLAILPRGDVCERLAAI